MIEINSYTIDRKLEPILRQMEARGVKIDLKYLDRLKKEIDGKIERLDSEIQKRLGHKFNLNSPSQLAEVLYKKKKIAPSTSGIRRGKTHYSTSHEALEKIINKHSAIKKILSYRELAKLKSTYIDPLPRLIGDDGRIHTHYAVDTSTGRLSSKNPNLQNIPVRTEEGKKIKRAFIANEGFKLLKADYSQIQLRIATHLSDDKNMMEIFRKGGDVHARTSHELHCDRRTAKVVNFGVLYGMSAYGLAQTLKISREEAQYFIDKYFQTFSGIKEYCDRVVAEAIKNGYVKTLFGHRREISELASPNPRIVNFGKRAAINTPIQGTEADIVKLSMIALNDKLSFDFAQDRQISNVKSNYNDQNSKSILNTKYKIHNTVKSALLILQVHDELVFEIKNNVVKKIAPKIKQIMEGVVKLKVPVVVNLEIGDNWAETKKI